MVEDITVIKAVAFLWTILNIAEDRHVKVEQCSGGRQQKRYDYTDISTPVFEILYNFNGLNPIHFGTNISTAELIVLPT